LEAVRVSNSYLELAPFSWLHPEKPAVTQVFQKVPDLIKPLFAVHKSPHPVLSTPVHPMSLVYVL